MTDKDREQFEQLAIDAGIPTSESSLNVHLKKITDESNLIINNDSDVSPFWRFVQAAISKPVLWLVNFMIDHVLAQAFVKTATGPFLVWHAWAVGLEKKSAVYAKGNLQFSRTDTSVALTIEAGTVIHSTLINGKTYSVETTEEVLLSPGEKVVLVPVKALETGEGYNLGAGYYVRLAVPLAGVTVTNLEDWLTIPGADIESDDELRLRTRNQYTAINQWHTDASYTAIIAGFSGLNTENIFFEHNAPRGPGTANAYVMLDIGNPSEEFIASIQYEITDKGNHGHGDDLMVKAMPETDYSIECSLWFVANTSEAEKKGLIKSVGNFIRAAFRENIDYSPTLVYPWSLFGFSQLSREIQEQFPQISNIYFNHAQITSTMDLPRLGNLTVAEAES
ncbi:baseplate J/gp47 family protein [Microbulbifer variabilis]|uniref:Baseplate J/gp47 family protein n=1 Tax=Microbulbifer variabilis TaxID=266805 RepID=A0ABY4V664_9GAMM|nr:baseplate J/gp47 family protein [Microbulbifer variabilis]USD19762.1 baseplate J/gp47 family protein [Microbulbifer variabilis]